MDLDQLFYRLKSRNSSIDKKELLEKAYYEELSKYLKSGQYDNFKNLFNASIDFNLFIDVRKIPNRFEIISQLLISCIEQISAGYQTSSLGEIVDILRFCNEYNLFDKEISISEKKTLEIRKKDKLFLANLNDLFGKISNSFILFVYKVIPRDLYRYFMNMPSEYFPDRDGLIYYIKNIFFDQYTVYGLSVRYLSPIEHFINTFKRNSLFCKIYKDNQEDQLSIKNKKFIEFNIIYKHHILYYDSEEEQEHSEIKKHLVSPKNISNNINNILSKNNYNFYSLSMVLLGGIGPQGLGFTYSTPNGEVIEICSDIKENEAIIIKFKKFLKNQFVVKLEKEMKDLHIKVITLKKIINYLMDALDKEEFIDYFKKESILYNIKKFLLEDGEYQDFFERGLKELINKISNAFHIILRPIKMMDQYKARMNLVARGILKSEDIAKLTSLKEKSHYDILRERFFFQYIVDWFYDVYQAEKLKNQIKNVE